MYQQLKRPYSYFWSLILGCFLPVSTLKEGVNRGNGFGALLTDLSKGFDCINNPLLIAKLYNYEVPPVSIDMTFSYLSNRTHWTKINECFSKRSRIERGVPQGSVLGSFTL